MKTNLETNLSDIVVLCSTRNEKVEEFQIQMIDSFVQNTPEECKLLIVENNSDEVNHRRWKDYVKTKGQNFIYSNTEYNMSKLYNEGTKLTNNEYIMYANSPGIKCWLVHTTTNTSSRASFN